jgi:hypothetical protein
MNLYSIEVLAFDVAKVAKPTEQCLLKVRIGGGGEITQTRRLRSLLRMCRERPRGCRAAEQHDEVAPSQMRGLHSIFHQPGAGYRISNGQSAGISAFDRLAGITVTMAAKNKSLARNNKSGGQAEATKGRPTE